MAADGTSGTMEKFTKDSGSMASNTAQAFGEEQRVIRTSANGVKAGPMATECIPGSTAIATKGNSKTV